MKEIPKGTDYLSILNEKIGEVSEIAVVREEVAPYLATKRQGEYTLEDYLAIPDEYRTELIDGVIYDMASPRDVHQIVIAVISNEIYNSIKKKKGKCIILGAPLDVQLDCDDRTVVQPDIQIVCDRSKFKNGRVFGAPDFVVEVLSPSTRKKDIQIKTRKYRNAGVREYWMVDIEKEQIIVYQFERSDLAVIYTFRDKIPVGIFGGECEVDFTEVKERILFLEE